MFNTDLGPGAGFNLMFTIIPILMVIGFVVVIGGIIMNGARYMKNKNAPRETVYAQVVAKRTEVRSHSNTQHHHNAEGSMHPSTTHSSRTYYYITLEFDNGERREFADVKNLYGLLVEGDSGYAAIQGDWLVAFERNGG
ncbi:DUF2500 domain-containing protein [Paenibacillus tarimensis]|uniref:DUF2500 domain-containing protein n=1 Tax=Paenibacillus tarimensis TaxID=416012 RepID=UPI001F3A8A1D|nr:DUF2500 domain-containing protein [Paenibacillus tarimensis]MCF2944894.1 DUF2500 domain-containing protein [Paenibacillus tarimensis]